MIQTVLPRAMGVLLLALSMANCGDSTDPWDNPFHLLAELHGPQFENLDGLGTAWLDDFVVSGTCEETCTLTTIKGDSFTLEAAGSDPRRPDAFVARLGLDGTLIWHLTIVGENAQIIEALAVNHMGDTALAGYSGSPEWDIIDAPGGTSHHAARGQRENALVAFFDQDGGEISSLAFQADDSHARAIDWADDDHAVVSVEFDGTLELDTGSATPTVLTSRGRNDVALVKLGTDGVVDWWLQLGGSLEEYSTLVRRFSDGSIKFTMAFTESVQIDRMGVPAGEHTIQGGQGLLVLSLSQEGEIQWMFSSGAAGSTLYLKDLAEDADGGFSAVGFYVNASKLRGTDGVYMDLPTFNRWPDQHDSYISRFESSGALSWVHPYGSWSQDLTIGIVELPTGDTLRAIGYGSLQGFSIEEVAAKEVDAEDAFMIDFSEAGEAVANEVLAATPRASGTDADSFSDIINIGADQNLVSFRYMGEVTVRDANNGDMAIEATGEKDALLLVRSAE
ncbi:MAG TPA: hypothetical protein PK668_08690 [Myxococcota bacterium]|nr:hypothetical protein [Myxococcota bacterium]HRY92945.1 hypothetical protein [Myxococcota bacterium]HSA21262.1 hypothetical protein [Myxococcota bacterium]